MIHLPLSSITTTVERLQYNKYSGINSWNDNYKARRGKLETGDCRQFGLVCVINIKHTIELCQHQSKNASRNSERRTEHNHNVVHRHLVDVGILHNRDKVRGQSTQKAVICDWQDRDKMRQFRDPFLGIFQV